jgi:hypothetical protein
MILNLLLHLYTAINWCFIIPYGLIVIQKNFILISSLTVY